MQCPGIANAQLGRAHTSPSLSMMNAVFEKLVYSALHHYCCLRSQLTVRFQPPRQHSHGLFTLISSGLNNPRLEKKNEPNCLQIMCQNDLAFKVGLSGDSTHLVFIFSYKSTGRRVLFLIRSTFWPL